MPGYVIHITFAKLVEEKLKVKDSNRFFVGSLIPDACTCDFDKRKLVSHFDLEKKGLFKNPDLDKFLEKYSSMLDDDVVLGIYSHLYLDKYYYNQFMYDLYEFTEKTMKNKSTGRVFKIWEEFFARNGIYEQYTPMNKMFIGDFDLDVKSLNFELKSLPSMPEFDYEKLKTFKNVIMGFVNQDGLYTGEYIKYEDIVEFLEKLADIFVKNVTDLRCKK